MSNEPCLSEQDLKAFSIGQLDPQRSDEIVAHLSVCARCEETVAALDNTDDSLLQGVREAAARQLQFAGDEAKDGSESASDAAAGAAEQELLRTIQNPWKSAPKQSAGVSLGEWIRDYELLEPLGQGGMGTVYKAMHARLNRPVAIKLLPARRLRDAAAVARFEREMKAIGCLDHPAIVRATDAGDAEGTHFLVMDFVDGIDLSQVVKLTGPLDVASACEVIRQAAAGLQYAHEQGLIHRDVKPSNLMVTLVSGHSGSGDGTGIIACVKLLDLGLALFGAASEAVDELTTVGQLMGTLDYMAPEQADNCHDVDVRADVYSLGATLFKLLTGTAPYETSERQSPLRKMKALATVDAPPVQSRRPELLSDIAEITDRMLKREPAQRYQTAAEVARAVTPLCAGHQLVERTKHALQLRAERLAPDAIRDGEAPAEPPTPRSLVPPAAQQELRPPGMSPGIAGNQSKPPRRRSFQVLLAAMGFFILLAAGVLFRIETDCGTLVIECAEHNVPVEIRQGNVPVKQLAVSAGMNMVTLRSGEYEVVLPTAYDSLHVESGKFELRRGDQWVVRIVEEAKPEIAAAASKSGIAIQPDPSPTASGGRQSPEASSNEDMVREDATRKDKPESDATDSMQSLSRELNQFSLRYAEEYAKILQLEMLAAELTKTYGDSHPQIRNVKQKILSHTGMLNNMATIMQELTGKIRSRIAQEFEGAQRLETTFQGRTFDQWKSILITERSDEELAKAVEAIGTLGRGTREPEAIELILKVIEQSPPVTTDLNNPSKSGPAAVRVIREIDAEAVASALTPGFSYRSDKIHAFVLIGLMNFPDLYGTDGNAPNRLAERAPVRQAMISSETFALELVRLIEKRSGLKTGDPALTQKIFSAPSIYSDFVPGYATSMIFEHIGKNKPGPALEQFLTRLLDHLAQTPQYQKLPWEAFAAASLLARFSPNERLPGIFVRMISEELDSARRAETPPLKANPGGEGFFPAAGHRGLSDIVRASFENLSRLGAFAESTLPFMLEIVGKPAPEGTLGAVALPNQMFHEGHVLYLASKADSDPSVPNRDASTIAWSHRGFAVNLRLLAMEVIVSSGTKDPKVLDLLRAELKKQLGQEPTDGPHELLPGREFLLLRDDPNAAWKGPGTTTYPGKMLSFGGGGAGGFSGGGEISSGEIPTSPLDVELVNSTLLAWKSITGSWPRFAEPSLGQLGNRSPEELGQTGTTPEKTLEFLPKFQPVAGLQP